jgi:23S rRNA (uracil1939-C5)-methyltransferase
MRGSRNEIVEATVTSLAPGGDGVAHVELRGERRAVFVPRSAPGDRLRVEIDASRRPARGRVVQILAPGPDRVEPACPWSDRCGGCDWMHLSLAAQRRAHAEQLRAALPEAWRDSPIEYVPASGEGLQPTGLVYRARARLHARSERRGGGRVHVGMHQAGTHDPVEVDRCAVLDPVLDRARALLAGLLLGSTGHGEVQLALGRLEAKAGEPARGEGRAPVLDVRWTGELAPRVFGALEDAVRAGTIAGAQVTLDGATRPAVIGDPTPWTAGADGLPLRLAPGGFGQASEVANVALVQHVAAAVRKWCEGRGSPAASIVELYCGSGNLSVVLAAGLRRHGDGDDTPPGDLVCVEADRGACEATRANLEARGLRGRVVEADANTFAWGAATKVLVLDPPRTGARAVAERLVQGRVQLVVYVSCDTQTLGRDLAVLAGTYAPASMAAFEMFPQTSHVETVAVLQRIGR